MQEFGEIITSGVFTLPIEKHNPDMIKEFIFYLYLIKEKEVNYYLKYKC
jgi:hypothetical protein